MSTKEVTVRISAPGTDGSVKISVDEHELALLQRLSSMWNDANTCHADSYIEVLNIKDEN